MSMQQEKTIIDIKKLARPNILAMKPYASARDEYKGEAEIFLDANENPFESGYNRYPDPKQTRLKKKISEVKNASISEIFLGNGSDEAIDLLIRIFCEPARDSVLVAEPTYGMYAVCAAVNAVNVQSVLLDKEFDIDVDGMLKSISRSTKIIFLCSPNNPTGNLLTRQKVIQVLQSFSGIVVIDEAYIDFADSPGFITEIRKHNNLIVLQTLSKAWGLAGLRVGIAFASPEIISLMNKVKYPYNVSVETQRLSLEALENKARQTTWVEQIVAERSKLALEFGKISVVEHIYPSDANFLLVRVKDAPAVYRYLLDKQIIVRDRSQAPLCNNCLRITIGTPEENKSLIQALKQL
jgi:histidinol-phosphate aminotransferase